MITTEKLFQIATIEKGQQIDTSNLKEDKKFKYINGGIKESGYFDNFNTEQNTVIISEGGASCGFVNFIDEPFWCGCHCYRLKNPKINPKYLYFALKYRENDLMDLRTGICMPNIKKSTLLNFELSYENNIELQNSIIKKCEKIQELIFIKKEEIECFEEIISSELVKLINKAKTFTDLYKLTTKITDGSHLPPKGIEHSNYLMLSSQNVFDELNLNDVRFLTKEDFEKENKRTDVSEGDVLLTIVGTIGRTHVVKKDEKYVFQRSVGVIKPKIGCLNGTFLSCYLQSSEAIDQLESGGHGSTQKGIYIQDLEKLQIPDVPFDEQTDFEKRVNTIKKQISIINKQIYDLEQLLKTKMHEHFGD